MTPPWRILVTDDDLAIAEQVAELLVVVKVDGVSELADVVPESSFEQALATLANGRFDLMVLDVRDQSVPESNLSDVQPDVGISLFEEIRARRFVPIVFYTALPHLVEALENPPFVQVISKVAEEPEAELRRAVGVAFDSGFPRIHRALENHMGIITRNFVVNFLEKHWCDFDDYEADFAHLLSRHLGISLERGADVLATQLGYEPEGGSIDDVHPTRYYVVPPDGDYKTGDLLHGPDVLTSRGDENAVHCWYVVLTPTCDLVAGREKADHVVLAECRPLEEFQEWKTWSEARKTDPEGAASGQAEDKLKQLMRSRPHRGQVDRYHYLPAAWQVPDLIVDNQRVVRIAYSQLEQYKRAASLDSPYAEALAHRFGRYLGRLGTPDLNIDGVLQRMGACAAPEDDLDLGPEVQEA